MKSVTALREFFRKQSARVVAAAVAVPAVIGAAAVSAFAESPNAAAYTAMVGKVSDETTGMSGFVLDVSPYIIALVALGVLVKLALNYMAMGGNKAK